MSVQNEEIPHSAHKVDIEHTREKSDKPLEQISLRKHTFKLEVLAQLRHVLLEDLFK